MLAHKILNKKSQNSNRVLYLQSLANCLRALNSLSSMYTCLQKIPWLLIFLKTPHLFIKLFLINLISAFKIKMPCPHILVLKKSHKHRF